jgi:hypothetical protein
MKTKELTKPNEILLIGLFFLLASILVIIILFGSIELKQCESNLIKTQEVNVMLNNQVQRNFLQYRMDLVSVQSDLNSCINYANYCTQEYNKLFDVNK